MMANDRAVFGGLTIEERLTEPAQSLIQWVYSNKDIIDKSIHDAGIMDASTHDIRTFLSTTPDCKNEPNGRPHDQHHKESDSSSSHYSNEDHDEHDFEDGPSYNTSDTSDAEHISNTLHKSNETITLRTHHHTTTSPQIHRRAFKVTKTRKNRTKHNQKNRKIHRQTQHIIAKHTKKHNKTTKK